MHYTPIAVDPDGSMIVRMFMDDGTIYDRTFMLEESSPAALLDLLVRPLMLELAASPPSKEMLDNPDTPLWLSATPEQAATAVIPDDAVEIVDETEAGDVQVGP